MLTLLAAAEPAVGQPQKPLKAVTLLTNYVFHGRHSPFFVGLEKGDYKAAGLDVTIAPAGGSDVVIAAVAGGKADFGMAEAASVVQAVAKGAKVKGFMVYMDVSTSGLASLKPYPTPQSLNDATIAAAVTDSARVVLPIIFRQQGLSPDGIRWEAADPAAYFSLLLGGKADLIAGSIDGDMPALMKLAQPHGTSVHFAAFADWGYDVFGYFLIAKAERIAAAPDEVRAFATATAKAVQYSIAHPDEAAEIMVKGNPTLNLDTTAAQWRQSMKAIETPYVKQHGYGVATAERLERTIALVRQALDLAAPPPAAAVFDSRILAR